MAGRSRYLTVLRDRNYAYLWSGQVTAYVGEAVYEVALIWLVLSMTDQDYGAVGLVIFVRLAAGLLSGPFAGVYVDRWDRRRTMVVCDLARSAVLACVPVLYLAGVLAVWQVAVMAALLTVLRSFFRPAMQASIPQLVEKSHLTTANALLHASLQVTMVVGPAAAGLALTVVSPVLLLTIDAGTYLISALLLTLMALRPVERERVAGSTVFSELASTVKEIYRVRPVFWTIVLFAVGLLAIAGTYRVGIPAFAEQVLGGGSAEFGLLMSSMAVGTLVGALGIGRLELRHDATAIFLGWLGWGACFALLALSGQLWLAMALAVLAGAAEGVTDVATVSLLQKSMPADQLGRTFSMWSLTAAAGDSTSSLIVGQALRQFQTVGVFAVSGLVTMAVAGFGLFATRRRPDPDRKELITQ